MITKCSPQDQSLVLDYFKERFGIERHLFKDFSFYGASKGRIFLGPKSLIDKPKPVTAGILIARISRFIKPTTNFFQLYGKFVKKNSVSLTRENATRFIRGEDLELSADKTSNASDGYVLVTYLDFPLGCSLLKGNRVKNMIPRPKLLDLEFL